ncbi:SEN2 [Candida pseudojiufengensis]|uniref:SEN2 n=1 Tax=Candida pseudojiufengensis TaxID=497109 RepID=UPI00222530CB|nr:SEN2 [Candida pseudojiufengensis]KAI5965692.1 SEN2 [Candida pseudojiufengensis]
MGKQNSRQLNKIYRQPLPIDILKFRNEITINPLSWIKYLINFFKFKFFIKDSPKLKVELDDGIFKVVDPKVMIKLWREGFFGKGILSRSEPTWYERTIERLNLVSSTNSKLTMEQVTKIRRNERNEFKKKRQRLQELILKQRQNIISEDEINEMNKIDEELVEFRKKEGLDLDNIVDEEVEQTREEDTAIIDPTTKSLIKLEFLQLQTVEAFFLKFALNRIEINDLSVRDLFIKCCKLYDDDDEIKTNNKFILNYVIYHYFRSKGWCVRSGIKFGVDFLLYKRGPPFSHAEYCISIFQNSNSLGSNISELDWFQMSTKARVVGGVKKNYIHCYIESPNQNKFNEILNNNTIDDGLMLKQLFYEYKISELIYRRWNPSRTRD